ncbi:MAG: hypothetical protein EOM15_07755, partial [Spirochaetia bacterium]|nr:hypothetical protein [Spirochaetia bacterium]
MNHFPSPPRRKSNDLRSIKSIRLHKRAEMKDSEQDSNKEGMFAETGMIAQRLEQRFPGWDSRRYIFAMLIYRYLSQKMEEFAQEQKHILQPYRSLDDEQAQSLSEQACLALGYFILPSGLFYNVYNDAPRDGNLGKTLEWVFSDIEESSAGYPSESVFRDLAKDIDIDGPALGPVSRSRKKKLLCLMDEVSNVCEQAISDLATTFEYLLVRYSRLNTKATGDVLFESRLVPDLLILLGCRGRRSIQSFYDPYCRTGFLLSHARFRLSSEGCMYGQSENLFEYNMARSFMFLLNIDPSSYVLSHEDSLLCGNTFEEYRFEVIASILPKNKRWLGDDDLSLLADRRFSPAGVVAPKTKTELAYVMHCIAHLADKGTATFAISMGALSRIRSEKVIRRWLLDNNLVDAVVRIPNTALPSSQRQQCVLVIRKGKSDNRILFVDATLKDEKRKFDFGMVGRIADIYCQRKEVPSYSVLVDRHEVITNGCDLTPFAYVRSFHSGDAKQRNSLYKAIEARTTEIACIASSCESFKMLEAELELASSMSVVSCAAVKMGRNVKTSTAIGSSVPVAYIRLSDLAQALSASNLVQSEEPPICVDAASVKMFEEDTVLFPKSAASIRSGRRGILAQRSAVDGNLLGLHARQNIEPEYLLYAFGSWLSNGYLARGDRTQILKLSEAVQATIKVPPKAVQQRIVQAIKTSELTECLMNEKLSMVKQYFARCLYELMASVSDEPELRICDVAEVSKILGYNYNKFVKYSEDGSCFALRGCNIKNGSLDLCSAQRLDDKILYKISGSLLHRGDILFSYVGTPGHVAVVDAD